MCDVFISHSTSDKDYNQIEEIVSVLNQNGITTWLAEYQIAAGDNWHDNIIDSLNEYEWFIENRGQANYT